MYNPNLAGETLFNLTTGGMLTTPVGGPASISARAVHGILSHLQTTRPTGRSACVVQRHKLGGAIGLPTMFRYAVALFRLVEHPGVATPGESGILASVKQADSST